MTGRMDWTEGHLATVKEMWLAGSTASAIGKAIGTSRNAVMGRISRMKLPRRTSDSKALTAKLVARPQVKRKPPKMPSKKGMNRAEVILRNAEFLKSVEPFEEVVLDISCRNVPLLELKTFGMCRWPFGDVRAGGVTYCGNDCNVKDSYCAPHKALAYRPVTVLA